MPLATLIGEKETLMVGLADFKVTSDPEITLSSAPLGACLAVIIYEPTLKVAGLLHSLLTSATVNPARAANNPALFLDAGLAAMVKRAEELKASVQNLEIYVVGGAEVMGDTGAFNVGQCHYQALTALLGSMGLTIKGVDVGGRNNRSVLIQVGTGEVRVKLSGQTQLKTLCKR